MFGCPQNVETLVVTRFNSLCALCKNPRIWTWSHFENATGNKTMIVISLQKRLNRQIPRLQEHQSWWGWGSRPPPQFWAGGVAGWSQGGREGLWTGREILLYLTIYRKSVKKWWLLKRNRIICQEVAVNGQFLPEILFKKLNCLKNRKFSKNFPGKSKFFSEIAWKKSKFFVNLPGKIEKFFTWTHDPHISNQIDAAARL